MMRRVIAALMLLLAGTVATAQVPFPQTLPPNTVYGRLGVGAGPGQAIPFSVLSSRLLPSGVLAAAACDGVTDDTAAIQAAINGTPINGGTVFLPLGTCKVSSSLTIGNGTASTLSARRGVILAGTGISNSLPAAFSTGYATAGGTKLLWAGGGSPVIRIDGPLEGWGVQNLVIDCQSTAGSIGLLVTSARGGDNRNLFLNNCSSGINSTSHPIGGFGGGVNNVDSIHNNWLNTSVSVPNIVNATGIILGGANNGTSDTDFNTFTNTVIRFQANVAAFGIYFAVSDDNIFNNLTISGGGGSNVYVVYDYSINSTFPSGNMLVGVDTNGIVGATQFLNVSAPGGGARPNYIFGLMEANGAAVPSLANLSVFSSGQTILNGATSGRAAVVTQAVAGTPTLTLPNTSGTFQTALPAPLAANTTTGVAAWSGLTTNGVLYAGSATTVASDRCTMDGSQIFSCTSASAFSPQFNLTNTTADANATFFQFNKNRTGGNTNANDTLGTLSFRGFANSAQQSSATIAGTQTATSSGSNTPSKITLATSNTAGQLNQTWTFNEKGHMAVAASAAPTLTAGCNGAGTAISGNNVHGTATGQTAAATTCTLTFANSGFTATPDCTVTGLTSPLTGVITPSTTTLVVNFASTANYKFTWHCYGL